MSRPPAAVDQFSEAQRAIFVSLLAQVALAAALREEERDEADEVSRERRHDLEVRP